MNSIHAKRWIDNLQNADYELFWFDILNQGSLDFNSNVVQITNWQKRKIPYIKGEFFLRKKFPLVFGLLQPFLQVTIAEHLTKIIHEINPDVIHSFEMQSCSYPILKTLNKFPKIKWIYSCWGSDLYYYQNLKDHNLKIKAVLKRVNYLQTDCERDINIAKNLGFKGKNLEVIPGGTGFELEKLEPLRRKISQRNIILVKGYEHNFGRALIVVKALQSIQNELSNYKVVVFGAHKKVIDYIKINNLSFGVLHKDKLNHEQVIELMGKSLIYIGNSISDGMPNTLLEAIVMGAFPIQSNPGGVSQEIIENNYNGLLIDNPENILEITKLILYTLNGGIDFEKVKEINMIIAKKRLDYSINQEKVKRIYNFI